MHFPVTFPVGEWEIPAHSLFEALGYASGFQLFRWLRRRQGDAIPAATRWLVVAAAAGGALLGSRLLYLLQNPAIVFGARVTPGAIAGGKTIVGGLLGGLAAVEIMKRSIGERRPTGDLFVLPLCLGMAVGRIGCFLAGLSDPTYGSPCTLPWGVDLGDGVSRHPVQLYEIAALGAIGAWSWRRGAVEARPGERFRTFIMLYLAFRLGVEFLKPNPKPYAGLSAIQWAAIAGLGYYATVLWRERTKAA